MKRANIIFKGQMLFFKSSPVEKGGTYLNVRVLFLNPFVWWGSIKGRVVKSYFANLNAKKYLHSPLGSVVLEKSSKLFPILIKLLPWQPFKPADGLETRQTLRKHAYSNILKILPPKKKKKKKKKKKENLQI